MIVSNPVLTTFDHEGQDLFDAGDLAGAENVFRRALVADPQQPRYFYKLGVVLAKQERFPEAAEALMNALRLNQAFTPAYTNLGFCLNELGHIASAREAFRIAETLDPDDPIPVLNGGIAALALGDYTAGWEQFEARWNLPAYAKFRRDYRAPLWQGGDINGKTLFLYAEQGFGDALQMARYVPLVAARGARVVLEVFPALVRLFASLPGVAQILPQGETPPAFDLHCPLMSLPRAFGTEITSVPAAIPYLAADPRRIDYWRTRLPQGKRLNVGLVWAGRASHENDRNRSLPLRKFENLWRRADIGWVGLQRPLPAADTETVAALGLLNLGEQFTDFAETAAAIMALDLVISVDTAVAHLAGALGKPVWLLLPFYPDWRWLMGREDSPWYPSARLFRQAQHKAWDPVLERVNAALNEFTPRS
jgi:tetratricopeptide (TPR) repeat protein